jgi:uncharacterized membrane protein
MKVLQNTTLTRVLPWLLIICGSIGLAAAFTIMVEKIHLLDNPGYTLPCDLNPVISCGSVMASAQSNAFGFPNPIIGLVAFPVVIMVGVLLLSGIRLRRWHMLGLQAGALFGLLFVHWLFFQSVYRIGALCPYCMAVWLVTITTFWYVLLYNIQEQYIVLRGRWATAAAFARRHHLDILIFWFLILLALMLKRFWYYYGPLLGF